MASVKHKNHDSIIDDKALYEDLSVVYIYLKINILH